MDTFFASCAPGVEVFTENELRSLGLENGLQAESGGVTFRGGLEVLYRANLHLRTASRVLVRLGNFFYARTFAELRERAARLPWERFLRPGQPVILRITCHKSKLYHSEAVAERIQESINERLGRPSPRRKPLVEEFDGQTQVVLARLDADRVSVSVDSSGELLHRRGYRLAVAKAPLRETLAAVLLMASGWDLASPLLDPFCGSGAIPIEAALMARRIAPGLNRSFAFMDWPFFDASLWESALADARAAVRPCPAILQASDRDAGAIEMARANAGRAGVAGDIEFTCRAVSDIQPPPGPGWVVSNPPYGMRVSQGKDLRNLYAQLGNVLRRACPGWQVSLLCSDRILLGHTGLGLEDALSLVNGGLPVRVGRGRVREEKMQ
jgi:putative N6-adenine-specific DNA methylase